MAGFVFEAIPKTRAGIDFFLAKYKPFRLQALETEPVCKFHLPEPVATRMLRARQKPGLTYCVFPRHSDFSSTYATEVAFTDEQWEQRILSPIAFTWVAVSGEGDSRRILSSATLVNSPIPPGLQWDSGRHTSDNSPGTADLLHLAVNAVYTAPEARRLGISTALMTHVAQRARDMASAEAKDCLLTVVVERTNDRARPMYEKLGYAFSNERVGANGKHIIQLFQLSERDGKNSAVTAEEKQDEA